MAQFASTYSMVIIGPMQSPTLPGGKLAQCLGEPLKGLQVPEELVSQIVATLRKDQKQSVSKLSAERLRLEGD